MSRYRLTFTVDLIGEHEQPDQVAATEKARELYEAFHAAMARLAYPGVLLPVANVAPHPFPDPEPQVDAPPGEKP
jgi:hypothetical protein